MLAFTAARWNAHVDPFPQHTMLFQFADTGASATELLQVLPRTYGVWELGSNGSGSYRQNLRVESNVMHDGGATSGARVRGATLERKRNGTRQAVHRNHALTSS